ncbi:hypothetical protein [Methanobacterium sp. ACI-7]|uniref:hypothetical protein n=1 Tax=unclassified Methanobacterium TaxID=2627676 RepID=UPI0039C44D22
MDQRGYVISGLSFLLIIPAIYLVAVFADMNHTGSQSQALVIQSDVVSLTVRDIEGNLPFIAKRILQKTANEVMINGNPIPNSRMNIKNNLQIEIDTLAGKYSSQEGINVTCRIISVDSSRDPFKVQINSSISVSKGNVLHTENLSQDVSIIDHNYPIPDPLPFIKCKNFGGVTNTSSRIIYGSSLANFHKNSARTNSDVYINATSPLVIKKCPYDPYINHGQSRNNINLKNCIDNGYYHESSDGACFLCRLEGKGVCSHYGMETFIIPQVSGDNSSFEAPCSSDHVIFDGNYSGYTLTYYSNSNGYYNIFLEKGHRTKYGFT